ncbi:MAG: hypothetical protein FVQ81_11345 [Candidatus Glassbacteria bacterium]|nr:hypothetical protein [Candidatus Glassbacteria bacterium]
MRRREFAALAGAGVAALAASHASAEMKQSGLRAGRARVDITPEAGCWLSGWASRTKPADGMEDPLYARALVLESGDIKVALLATDLIGVPGDVVARVRGRVRESCGIAPDCLMITATHTHFGPAVREYEFDGGGNPDYVRKLEVALAECVERASTGTQPARLGADSGSLPEQIYNRRPLDSDGKAVMTWRLPPNSSGLIFGPVDPEVGVVRVEDLDSNLLGSVVNYACHPVAGGSYDPWFYHISADYPGISSGIVESGEGGVCLFTLGTSGNINPRERGRLCRGRVGRALGGESLRVLQRIETSEKAALAATSRQVTLSLKREHDKDANHRPPPGQSAITVEVQGIRLGDCILIGLPGEVLVELGLEIKRRSGVDKLFVVSLANDTIGYICHRESYEEGGYEPGRGSQLAPGTGELVVATALEVAGELQGA